MIEQDTRAIPIGNAPSVCASAARVEELRHDKPGWPVRSPADAANALLLHGECAWDSSTRVAALRVSDNDYQWRSHASDSHNSSWSRAAPWQGDGGGLGTGAIDEIPELLRCDSSPQVWASNVTSPG